VTSTLGTHDDNRDSRIISQFERIELMKPRRINADKPHLWKADIAASVDQFKQWFMRFAPEAFPP
jgi:hypothetical protein